MNLLLKASHNYFLHSKIAKFEEAIRKKLCGSFAGGNIVSVFNFQFSLTFTVLRA